MNENIYYLARNHILDLHAEALGITDQAAKDALLNEGMVESALAGPRNRAIYEGADITELAPQLGFGLTLTCSDDYLAAWVIALTLGMSAETFAACLRSFVAPLA